MGEGVNDVKASNNKEGICMLPFVRARALVCACAWFLRMQLAVLAYANAYEHRPLSLTSFVHQDMQDEGRGRPEEERHWGAAHGEAENR